MTFSKQFNTTIYFIKPETVFVKYGEEEAEKFYKDASERATNPEAFPKRPQGFERNDRNQRRPRKEEDANAIKFSAKPVFTSSKVKEKK